MVDVSRRGVLKGLLATSIVLGFDPAARSWVTEASASDFCGLPSLDGTLTMDPTVVATYADDWGHIVHRTPIAILFPGSVQDIVKMVKFANAHNLKVGPRGRGHTAFGQSQVAGVLVDMSSLSEIHCITAHYADVDAGVVWRDLLLATTAVGRTPPVLTDYIALTIGGTLSVGGVGGRSHKHGAQVDNVLEIDVVTGEGKHLTCSRTQHRKLFDAALGGLGLCAIIVRVKVRLIRAKQVARTHRCFYSDVPTLLGDMRLLLEEQRFDHLVGGGQPSETGWVWYIEGTSFFDADDETNAGDPAALPVPSDPFAGLAHVPVPPQIEEKSYFEFCDAVTQLIAFLAQLGLTAVPHPWLDLFLPDSEADTFVSGAMADLDPTHFMPGSLVLFYAFDRSKLGCPTFRVPDEEVFFLFDLLHAAVPVPEVVAAALQRNRALYEQARELGGTQYTISAIEMTKQDWKKHFKPYWDELKDAKQKFDPDHVLGAGPGVFS